MESKHQNGQAVYAARRCEGRIRPEAHFEPLYVAFIKTLILYPYRKLRMIVLKLLNRMHRWCSIEKEL